MPNKSRDNHYVPIGSLRAFCEVKNQLYVYNNETQKVYAKSPKSIAYLKDFYTVDTIDEKDSDEIEQALGKIESVTIPIIRKLAGGKALNKSERADLAIYVALQNGRTPRAREQMDMVAGVVYTNEAKKIIAEIIDTPEKLHKFSVDFKKEYPDREAPTREMLIEWLIKRGRIYDINIDNGTFVKHFFERVPLIADELLARKWVVIHAPKGSSFITSDNPIGLYLDRELKAYETLAILLKGVVRYIPLSRDACLIILEEEYSSVIEHSIVTKKEVRRINKLLVNQAKKYLISGNQTLIKA